MNLKQTIKKILRESLDEKQKVYYGFEGLPNFWVDDSDRNKTDKYFEDKDYKDYYFDNFYDMDNKFGHGNSLFGTRGLPVGHPNRSSKSFDMYNKRYGTVIVRVIKESIRRILKEKSDENDIKSILFKILNQSEYIKKFDYIWSPNLSVGSPIVYVNNLSEDDFFNEKIDLFDLIKDYWPYEDDYENWKELYYGLVYGYLIKDKYSNNKIIIQLIRFKDGFEVYINPNYKKEIEGEKIFIDDKIMNLFGFDDTESNNVKNNFSEMGEELSQVTKTMENYKIIFKYLDAVI